MLDYKLTTLVCQQKNFENRLIFGEIMGKSLVSCSFLTHDVYFQLFGCRLSKLCRIVRELHLMRCKCSHWFAHVRKSSSVHMMWTKLIHVAVIQLAVSNFSLAKFHSLCDKHLVLLTHTFIYLNIGGKGYRSHLSLQWTCMHEEQ